MPLNQAQQNPLRQDQGYSQETGQTPDKVKELTAAAADGDLTGSTQQEHLRGGKGEEEGLKEESLKAFLQKSI